MGRVEAHWSERWDGGIPVSVFFEPHPVYAKKNVRHLCVLVCQEQRAVTSDTNAHGCVLASHHGVSWYRQVNWMSYVCVLETVARKILQNVNRHWVVSSSNVTQVLTQIDAELHRRSFPSEFFLLVCLVKPDTPKQILFSFEKAQPHFSFTFCD